MDGVGDEFEVAVDKISDIDRITLKVEMLPESGVEEESIRTQLKDQLRLKTILGYIIEFHEYGSLPVNPVIHNL